MTDPVIEFVPRVKRYPASTSHTLSEISAALATIETASVLPAVADQLRSSALAGTVHFSNLIEGNDLPFVEAQRAVDKTLDATTRSKLELVNYVGALDFIDQELERGLSIPREDFLLNLHKTLTSGLGREEDPHFKPHHEGAWRDGVALVVDPITSLVMHEGCSPSEVRPRMLGLLDWIARKTGSPEWPTYVIAGVAHYAITDIHPFADGNGRAARLMQVAILMDGGALPGRLFSFERYYATDKPAYLAALRTAGRPMATLNDWLDYFLVGLKEEYERVAVAVVDLNQLTQTSSSKHQLSRTQESAISTLRIEGTREFSRRDYEQASGLARSAAVEDLKGLVKAGIVRPVGKGPSTRYQFRGLRGASTQTVVGRPREWTEERIRDELQQFVSAGDGWPGKAAFEAAGKQALYIAATRNGGIQRWRRELGI